MNGSLDWRQYLDSNELALLAETELLLKPPPPPSGLAGWSERSLQALISKVPESLIQQLTQAISGALERMRQGGSWLVSKEAVYQRLERLTGPLRGSLDLLSQPVARLDEFCRDLVQTNTTGLTLEGAVAGISGAVGLLADIPILYCSLFRTIQEIALVYGFPVRPPQERFHVIQVLDIGHSLSHFQRCPLILQAFELQSMIRQGTTVAALESYLALGIRAQRTQTQALARELRLARQLAFDLLERKLFQGLVVLGSAIGAAANYQLARDVGLAARHLYRRRFLMELALRRRAFQ